MSDNRPGVRFAYQVASEKARKAGRAFPTFEEVKAANPALSDSFIQYNLMREGNKVMAGPAVKRTGNGVRQVYDTPVQLSPGEAPVVRTKNGTRPAYDVPYQDKSGQTVIRTRNGIRAVRRGGNY